MGHADQSILAQLQTVGEQEVERLRTRLTELLDPFDAFDVLTNLSLANLMIDPNRYKESSHEGATSLAVEEVML